MSVILRQWTEPCNTSYGGESGYMRFCDTHAHYDDEAFDVDRARLLGGGLRDEGVEFVVNMGASLEGAESRRSWRGAMRRYTQAAASIRMRWASSGRRAAVRQLL